MTIKVIKIAPTTQVPVMVRRLVVVNGTPREWTFNANPASIKQEVYGGGWSEEKTTASMGLY